MKNPPVRIGMDTSKSVFQLHGVDADEVLVIRRAFRRHEMIHFFEKLPPALVAIEACGSSHHWARLLTSLGQPRAAPADLLNATLCQPVDADPVANAERGLQPMR